MEKTRQVSTKMWFKLVCRWSKIRRKKQTKNRCRRNRWWKSKTNKSPFRESIWWKTNCNFIFIFPSFLNRICNLSKLFRTVHSRLIETKRKKCFDSIRFEKEKSYETKKARKIDVSLIIIHRKYADYRDIAVQHECEYRWFVPGNSFDCHKNSKPQRKTEFSHLREKSNRVSFG